MVGTGAFVEASRAYRFDDGLEVVLVMARRAGPFRIDGDASLPSGWGIGGTVSTAPLRQEHTAAIFADLQSSVRTRTSLWPAPVQGAAWMEGRPPRVLAHPRRAHVLDISGGFDDVYHHKFNKKTRRYHRLSVERGVEVQASSGVDLVPVLHRLIMNAVPRWAAQQNEPLWLARARTRHREPIDKFIAIAEGMGDRCRISVAWVDGRPAGAKLYLLDRNVESIWMALDPELGPSANAATALHVEMIRTACDRGCGYIDFGESGQSQGLEDAKRRLGAVGIDYESYAIERLPISRVEQTAKTILKRMVGFRDVERQRAPGDPASVTAPSPEPDRYERSSEVV
jgi:hypothetical protein